MTNRLTRIGGWGTKLNPGPDVKGRFQSFADSMNQNGRKPTVS